MNALNLECFSGLHTTLNGKHSVDTEGEIGQAGH